MHQSHSDLSRASLRNAKIGLTEWLVLHPTTYRGKRGRTVGAFKAHLYGTNLNGANLYGTNLNGLDLRGVDFSQVKMLSKAKFVKADLSKAIFREADLREADLREANLTGADLTGAKLNHITFVPSKILGSLSAWGNFKAAKLQGANLNGAYLNGVDLSLMDLTGTNLNNANLTRANLTGNNLRKTTFKGANLTEADLSYTILVETDLTNAKLEGCRVYGVSVWDVKLENAIQTNLVITPPEESTLTVDGLEVAQFIYLLLNNEKIRSAIDTIGKKAVLILGRFTSQRKAVLDAIKQELRSQNYLPVLFDFEKPSGRDLHETITTLARLSRFIIADITSPKSIPQELVSIVETLPSVPVQPLLQMKTKPWAMYDHIKRYPWVLPIHRYQLKDDLLRALSNQVIAKAEAKATELVP